MNNVKELSDVQSEAGIIATLINHPDYILYSEHLQPKHFYDITNGQLYWAIQELYKSGIDNIDAFNLTNIINSSQSAKNKIAEEIPNINDIIDLNKIICRNTIEEYKKLVSIVNTCAFKRSIYKNLQTCENFCYEDISLKDLQKNIYDNLEKTNMEFINNEDTPLFADIVRDLWNETVKRQDTTNGIVGIPSKFPELHNYCTYEKGELIIVSAYRKEGKSMFCMNELIDKIKKDIGVVYFDTEMNDRLFNERMICNLAGIQMKDLKIKNYSHDDEIKIDKIVSWLENKKNFVHIYTPAWTKEELYLTSKKLKRNNGIEFFVMDYFKSRNSVDASGAYLELGNAVDFVKNEICGDLELAGLGAAQLNRGGEIADSYKIEQYGSVIINLKRKTEDERENDGKQCGNYKLFIKLNRLGDQMDDMSTDYIDLLFEGNLCRFAQAKDQHKKDSLYK